MMEIIEALKSGKEIVHGTDTCVGLAVDVFNEAAVAKVYEMKQMSFDKPVSILCSDLEMAEQYGVFSEKALELAKKYLPGALTLIVPRTDKLPEWINSGLDSVGIRIPADESSLQMVRELGNPITTTSCNVSGEKVCESVDEVIGMFGNYMESGDVVLAFEERSSQKVSTVVKVDGDKVRVLRQGEVEIAEA